MVGAGNVAGGDCLRMEVAAGPGAHAVVATQAAEKIYRAAPGSDPCRIDVAINAGAGAVLDWLPQETIVFQGSRLVRRTVAEVAASTRASTGCGGCRDAVEGILGWLRTTEGVAA